MLKDGWFNRFQFPFVLLYNCIIHLFYDLQVSFILVNLGNELITQILIISLSYVLEEPI